MLQIYIDGIVVGVLASIPLGPIGVLIIQRTLNKGHLSGLISGAGAALSDTIYAIVAGFSLSFIIDFVKQRESMLQLIGSFVLLAFGSFIVFSNPVKQLRKQHKASTNYFQDFASTFVITLSNPVILFLFLGIFAGFSLVDNKGGMNVLAIITGIFSGGLLWWVFISSVVNFFRDRFNPRRLFWVNRISGVVIMTLAFFSVVYAIAKMVGANLPDLAG